MSNSMNNLKCFKTYDVRGSIGQELNEDIAHRIGRAYGQFMGAHQVAVGGDVRPSSASLKAALCEGLRDAGTRVLDLGLTGTEEIYYAVFSQNLDGGLEVTGSHNPISDNGIKFVSQGSRPLNSHQELPAINHLASGPQPSAAQPRGDLKSATFKEAYIQHLLSYIDVKKLPDLKVVANSGHGTAGPILDLLAPALAAQGANLEFIKIGHEPDGSFPLGIPNPLLPENRSLTAKAVRQHNADLGLAWDGDFDRCFFFDEQGNFIEGYYMVGLLAEVFLAKHPGATIIHDPRLTWNTIDLVKHLGGHPEVSKTGHAFMKEQMRHKKAVYGGEMSAHHYFADFAYCDSGMIPWLLVLELLGQKGVSISTLVAERQALFPCSGEINYQVENPAAVLAAVEASYNRKSLKTEHLDGLSLEMPEWRLNLRASNTEPLLRLNLETRGRADLVPELVMGIEKIIKNNQNQ